jgi:hypothetical protein
MRAETIAAVMMALLVTGPAWTGEGEDEEPSQALLEFLGSFETADGRWLDPTDLDAPDDDADEEGDEE